MSEKYLGRHLLLELQQCPPGLLSDPHKLEAIMQAAALEMKAMIVQSNFHHFSPLGVSGVVIISGKPPYDSYLAGAWICRY